MARKLPPLNALKAFEAAARHESFTQAADELCVTPGAISRQVQVLEEYLGLSLFTRKNREVVISDRGAIYRSVITNALDDINAATYKLRCDKKLHVSCYMTLSLRWLMPRLPTFHSANPDYSLMLTTTPPKIDEVSSGMIEAAILFGEGDWSGIISHELFPNELMPVCTPEMREKLDQSDPNDLGKVTLLHSQLRPNDWRNWLASVNADSVNPHAGMIFESSALAYDAAKNGMGVAIGLRALVDEDLENGTLVPAYDHVHRDGRSCYLAYSKKLADDVRVKRFRNWLLKQGEDYNSRVRFAA